MATPLLDRLIKENKILFGADYRSGNFTSLFPSPITPTVTATTGSGLNKEGFFCNKTDKLLYNLPSDPFYDGTNQLNATVILKLQYPYALSSNTRVFDIGGRCGIFTEVGGTRYLSSFNSYATTPFSNTGFVVRQKHWLAITKSSTNTVSFYKDGVLSGTADQASGSTAGYGTGLYIGNNSAGARPINSTILCFYIISGILSATEIQQLQNELDSLVFESSVYEMNLPVNPDGKRVYFKTGFGAFANNIIRGGISNEFLENTIIKTGGTAIRYKLTTDIFQNKLVKVIECTTGGSFVISDMGTCDFRLYRKDVADSDYTLREIVKAAPDAQPSRNLTITMATGDKIIYACQCGDCSLRMIGKQARIDKIQTPFVNNIATNGIFRAFTNHFVKVDTNKYIIIRNGNSAAVTVGAKIVTWNGTQFEQGTEGTFSLPTTSYYINGVLQTSTTTGYMVVKLGSANTIRYYPYTITGNAISISSTPVVWTDNILKSRYRLKNFTISVDRYLEISTNLNAGTELIAHIYSYAAGTFTSVSSQVLAINTDSGTAMDRAIQIDSTRFLVTYTKLNGSFRSAYGRVITISGSPYDTITIGDEQIILDEAGSSVNNNYTSSIKHSNGKIYTAVFGTSTYSRCGKLLELSITGSIIIPTLLTAVLSKNILCNSSTFNGNNIMAISEYDSDHICCVFRSGTAAPIKMIAVLYQISNNTSYADTINPIADLGATTSTDPSLNMEDNVVSWLANAGGTDHYMNIGKITY